ncbi:VOC family protein [Gordonia sp. SID5947]|uniref:VOC family protein n=1 Tax=Gordonia sp. SID5947 TaxID=2690315 RepID=UPI00136BCA5F|nr:VOC family protein [Gordonia sp. SID5947]MYR07091.1 VOC family protein [Gordonia sp. SID5947]
MASHLVCPVVNSRDPEGLAGFWCRALGIDVTRRWSDDRGTEFVEIGSSDHPCQLLFQAATDPAPDVAHLHLDIRPSHTTQIDEVRHLRDEGAVLVADDADLPWVVLADPEGNQFCVLPTDDGCG